MIRHLVMFQLASQDAAERTTHLDEARRRLQALVGVVPGLQRLDVHGNVFDDARNSDFVIDADFDDVASLETYITHPAHVEAADYIATIRADGTRAAIDFEV